MYTRTPYASNRRPVASTAWIDLLTLHQAWHITEPAFRVSGPGIDWQLVLRGVTGEEVLASGSIPSGSVASVRVGSLPRTLGGALLILQARLTSAGSAVTSSAEASWIPALAGLWPTDG